MKSEHRDGCENLRPDVMLSAAISTTVGLFDEDYFFGRTDGEFTFRLTLAGQPLYAVPQAICYHRVKKRGLSKVFYQIRNRWYFTLTLYAWRTIVLAAPALLLYELSIISFLWVKGAGKDYFAAISQVLGNLPMLMQKRQTIQAHRQVSDKEVLRSGTINMRRDLAANPMVYSLKTALNIVLNVYWRLIHRFI